MCKVRKNNEKIIPCMTTDIRSANEKHKQKSKSLSGVVIP